MAVTHNLEMAGLQPDRPYVTKILQLYETLEVRHGVMIVGAAGTGKTTAAATLAAAETELARAGRGAFAEVHQVAINPKALTIRELYGYAGEPQHVCRARVGEDPLSPCSPSLPPLAPPLSLFPLV